MDTVLYAKPSPSAPPLLSQPPKSGGETVFLQENGITVTNARFIVPGQTFAMSGITSVRGSKVPAKSTPWVIIGGIGLLLVFSGIGSRSIGLGSFGGLMLIVGVLGFVLSKPSYRISVNTAGGDQTAYESRDQHTVDKVISALNDAIISRG